MQTTIDMTQNIDFEEIRPYNNNEYREKVALLIQEPDFKKVIATVMPEVDFDMFGKMLLSINTIDEFQKQIIAPFVQKLIIQTTNGLVTTGIEHISHDKNYTFMSNHRDIVLDASFLCYDLLKQGYNTCEIAIGSNLLIYQWIRDLVRINKSFIVKRGVGVRQALDAAMQLSAYIHYAINQKHQSVWIAQREGRAKDSNDRTQEALIKMLTLGKKDSLLDSIRQLNIAPVTISYEYDPCDSLKAYEFLQKSKNPDFKKSQSDDLVNMQTGIMGYKGIVNYSFTPCINDELSHLEGETDKATILQAVCHIIDQHIHLNYRIYPGNYIAYDALYDCTRFADRYTAEQKENFEKYIQGQIAKIGEFSIEDYQFMREKVLLMYSNPLKNQLEAQKNV